MALREKEVETQSAGMRVAIEARGGEIHPNDRSAHELHRLHLQNLTGGDQEKLERMEEQALLDGSSGG